MEVAAYAGLHRTIPVHLSGLFSSHFTNWQRYGIGEDSGCFNGKPFLLSSYDASSRMNRLPGELFIELDQGTMIVCSFSAFVIEATRVALENLEEEEASKEE